MPDEKAMKYKVVTSNLQSLGLRNNPNILEYKIRHWIHERNPIRGKMDYGGIWVAQTKSNAKGLSRYMKNKYSITTKIFKCEIGEILYENSYRLKTNKVKLLKQIEND